GGGLQYSAILTEVTTGAVVWNKAIALGSAETTRADLLSYVSDRLSVVLGSPRGPLFGRSRALLADYVANSGGENLYICRVLFDLYRERETQSAGEKALHCFDSLGERAGRAGQAMAARASLSVEGISDDLAQDMPSEERQAWADDLLAAAVKAAPVSA